MFFANIKTSKKRQDIFQSQQKKQVRTIFGSAQSINEDTKQCIKLFSNQQLTHQKIRRNLYKFEIL